MTAEAAEAPRVSDVTSPLDGHHVGTVPITDPENTLAGTGESGYSGVMGDEGIKAFSIPKSITQARIKPTTRIMGAWLPHRVGPRYWKFLSKALFGWRR